MRHGSISPAPGRSALEALAAATGGQVLAGTKPLARSSLVWQLQPVWRPWLLLALAVLAG